MIEVVNAAVEKAYKGREKISWMEIYTGERPLSFTMATGFPRNPGGDQGVYRCYQGPVDDPVVGSVR